MRAVLDTNVLVSGFVCGGQPLEILDFAEQGLIELVTCNDALSELLYVLQRDKFSDRLSTLDVTANQIVSNYCEVAVSIIPDESIQICDDISDNLFIGIAVASEADIIVSGDRHLLDCADKSPVPIVNASEFLSMLRELTSSGD